MRAGDSKRLVIDACVARGCGGTATPEDLTMKSCRDFLRKVLEVSHRMVLTPLIGDEWKRHRKTFARQWQYSMEARKKVYRVNDIANGTLSDKIKRAAVAEKDCEEMLKDLHLIEAALVTDRIVVSLDEDAREPFTKAAQSVGELRHITWVNPDKSEEKPLRWLDEGANCEKSRQLGFVRKPKRS